MARRFLPRMRARRKVVSPGFVVSEVRAEAERKVTEAHEAWLGKKKHEDVAECIKECSKDYKECVRKCPPAYQQ